MPLIFGIVASVAAPCRADAWKPRCAVIATATDEKSSTIASLVEAELSARQVRLVDRAAIDHLVQEQSLSKSGLANGDEAVAAGRLLSADMLALISTAADGGSLVVFDANTGACLADLATTASGQALADELSRDIMIAINKDARVHDDLGPGNAASAVKTVCLQAVRNVDLPEEGGAIARASGDILVRRLTASPEVTVLERERLDRVTRERELTGVENALLASTISIELQISRDADGTGLDVGGMLVSASRLKTPLPSIRVAGLNPDEIATAILPAVIQQLRVAPPQAATVAQRNAESKRFVREATLLWSTDQVDEALGAAEAAYALDPHNFHAGATRARAIMVSGLTLACMGEFVDPSRRTQLDIEMRPTTPGTAREIPEPMMILALQRVDRACDALEALEFGDAAAQPATSPSILAGMTTLDADPVALNAQELLRQFLCKIRYETFERHRLGAGDPLHLTPAEEQLLANIQKQFRHRRFDLERASARALVSNPSTLFRYEAFVDDLLRDARCAWSVDGSSWTEDWAVLLTDWVVLEKQFNQIGDFRQRRFLRRFPSTHPIFSTTAPSTRPLGVAATQPNWPEILKRRRATTMPFPSRFAGPSGRVPQAVVDIAGNYFGATEWGGTYSDLDWKMTSQDWQRLIDATQALTQLGGIEPERVAQEIRFKALPYIHPEPEAVASNRPDDAPPPRERRFRRPVDVKADAATSQTVGEGTPWSSSRVLSDFSDGSGTVGANDAGCVVLPKIDYVAKFVYALTLSNASPTDRPQQISLSRFRLSDGAASLICSLSRDPDQAFPDLKITSLNRGSAALEDGYYVYCDPLSGVYLFPLAGGDVQVVNESNAHLPSSYYQSAAVLDKTLYLALGGPGRGGYLVAYDLKTKALTTLASGKRLAADPPQMPANQSNLKAWPLASPFDDQLPLFIWYILADQAQHRIVFLVNNVAWPKGLNGWWDFRPATGRFSSILPMDLFLNANEMESSVWATPLKDRRVAFGAPATQPSILDLSHDSVSPLPRVPPALGYTGRSMGGPDAPALQYPFAEADGWVWGRFGRYRPADSKRGNGAAELQSFDPLSRGSTQWGEWPTFLEPLDGDDVVVGEIKGLWLLHVPSDDPVAMGRLIKSPRPLYVSLDPIREPPLGDAMPWSSVQTIYDVLRNVNVGADPPQALIEPRIVGDTAYVFAGGGSQSAKSARLFKYSLQTGVLSELGRDTTGSFDFLPRDNGAEQAATSYGQMIACVDDQFYYITDPSNAIHAFPLAGGDCRVFKMHGRVVDLAAVGGKLFVALNIEEPGSGDRISLSHPVRSELLRVTVASGRSESLPLPEAPSEPAPPDLVPTIDLRLLRSDQRRQRVLFFLNCQPKAKSDLDGLWSCSPTGSPRRIDQLGLWASTGERMGDRSSDHGGEIEGDSWLLQSANGAFTLNIASLQIDRLWQVEPAGQTALDSQYDFTWPLAVIDGSLWDGYLRRAALDGSAFEQFPWIRPMDLHQYSPHLPVMRSIHNGRDLLMADSCGMWIAKMKSR